MPSKIEEYAVIGDCHTAALVGRDGSIDWLCFPRFDSGACFASLLGTPENGRWRIAPTQPLTKVTRRYRDDTLVLDTTFETSTGAVTLTDCMPVRTEQPDLIRVITGVEGKVSLRSEWVVRFDYGSITPWIQSESTDITAIGGPDTLHLRSPIPLHAEGSAMVGEFEVSQGRQLAFTLNWHPSNVHGPRPIDPLSAVETTVKWWEQWSSRCSYDGSWREAVIRSLITLKALTYAPTGGIVAAATTSLPEFIGGQRNWDYRICWLRDATFTLSALLECGYLEEAKAWRRWLVRAVAGKGSELHIMYGLAGERRLPELELPWLSGYENSQPVRIGNQAHTQFQLDVFGEVLDCLHLARKFGLNHDSDDWRIERELLDQLDVAWHEPDEGIWEVRGPRRHFTHSKVMAWVAFDRAVKDVERFGHDGPVEHWRKLRDQLHAEICTRGFNKKLNSFVQSYEGTEFDAALLMMTEVGFLPPTDPRIIGTIEAVERHLLRDGLVMRYSTESGIDGLPGGEGAFLLCTFWLADNYHLMGRTSDALEVFERLLSLRNDVGLLAEQYDPAERRLLGNFPQAFSHVGLINSARTLGSSHHDRTSRSK